MTRTYCALLHVASTTVSGEGQKALPLSNHREYVWVSSLKSEDSEDFPFSELFSFSEQCYTVYTFHSSSVDKEHEQFFGCYLEVGE